LLNVPKTRKGSVALQSEQYLVQFLDILNKLERTTPANSDNDQPETEESELQQWADLRSYQMKFQEAGNAFGLI
jgi:hypothetical protein